MLMSGKINMEYAHTHNKGSDSVPGTLVLNLLTKDHLKQMLDQHANKMMMMIGLSICSSHDQFNKATGRTIAIKRLTPVIVDFHVMYQKGTKHIYHFTTELELKHKKYKIEFEVTSVLESDRVNLINATIFNKHI